MVQTPLLPSVNDYNMWRMDSGIIMIHTMTLSSALLAQRGMRCCETVLHGNARIRTEQAEAPQE